MLDFVFIGATALFFTIAVLYGLEISSELPDAEGRL
jgi:hypothetical protein